MKKGELERWLGGRQKKVGETWRQSWGQGGRAGRLLWKVERQTGRIDRQGK
jgi:hypothetical protein